MRVLAGDIGGTNARLAVVDVGERDTHVMHEGRYPTPGTPGLAPIVRRYLADLGTDAVPERACFGIAGPVVDGECRTPNLPWMVSAAGLAAEIGIPATTIINDFQAVGYGLPRLGPADLVTLQAGEAAPRGTIALIGAGTGLGQGFLVWMGGRYRVQSSEGGHVAFAARDPTEWGLRGTLLDEFGHVSYERILSGPGLERVYRYLAHTGFATERPDLRQEMEREDPAAVITRHGLAKDDALSTRALELFVSVYGAQAGQFALTVLATGGVYVAGGIAPRIIAKLQDGAFVSAFRSQGRLSDLAARLPLHVIVSPVVGLLGAAARAAE